MTHSEQWVPRKYRIGSGKCAICHEPLKINEQECCQRCQDEIAQRAREIREQQMAAERDGTARKRPSVTNGPPPPYVMRHQISTSVRWKGVGKRFE